MHRRRPPAGVVHVHPARLAAPHVGRGIRLIRLTPAPFHLDEGSESDGSHCLYLFDGDMEQVADVFEQHKAESHGHGWEGLAESLVRSRMPEDVDKLHFGSEAGTFVVTSPDLTALTDLAVLLHSAFHDRELLSHYIQTADPALPRPLEPASGATTDRNPGPPQGSGTSSVTTLLSVTRGERVCEGVGSRRGRTFAA
ncbi:Imm51 family immunity protein [Streptomyces erythrochromogenes]|uniref:Imm51 family immunity protein n=1 Tax=Streptomyces erythrochromogenes TaxID=285574 RepID=UPI0033E53042